MLKENPIIVYTADCRGSLENCVYQNRIEITDTHAAAEAFRFDSVFAQYKNDYRSKENFLGSNALPMDCDNDHSDEPTDWITPEDIGFFFAGVPHILHFSRHHMKRKGDNSPRPRFHVIFLIDPTTSEQEYAKLKEQIMGVYSNASNAITEEEYHAKHGELCSRFEQTEEKLNGLRQQRERMQSDAIAIGGMLFELTELDALPITFNEKLWNAAIDRVTVYADERVLFHFKDGKDITELL